MTPLLRAAGHDVYTPTLTGSGERVHLRHPGITLDTHIQDIVNVLRYEGLHEVVLVGWSYGGMVIAGVAEQVPDRSCRETASRCPIWSDPRQWRPSRKLRAAWAMGGVYPLRGR